MNKDLIILLQNSMAHATNIAIANKKEGVDIKVEEVLKVAKLIASDLAEVATPISDNLQRKPGEPRR